MLLFFFLHKDNNVEQISFIVVGFVLFVFFFLVLVFFIVFCKTLLLLLEYYFDVWNVGSVLEKHEAGQIGTICLLSKYEAHKSEIKKQSKVEKKIVEK